MADQPGQQQPESAAYDGLMRISKAGNSETIKLMHFILEDAGVAMNEIPIEVQYRTGQFAVAAMLKGLEEFYFKPAGMGTDPGTQEYIKSKLEAWFALNKYQAPTEAPKSKLILTP